MRVLQKLHVVTILKKAELLFLERNALLRYAVMFMHVLARNKSINVTSRSNHYS